jgi:hypothetical protein
MTLTIEAKRHAQPGDAVRPKRGEFTRMPVPPSDLLGAALPS